ncbi:MAG: S41 family peptidase [Clostridia bacterium]|jgi:peptidase, S41 family
MMESDKKQRVYKIIMLVILTVIITMLLTTIAVYQYMKSDGAIIKYVSTTNNASSVAATLENFRKIIDNNYLGEIDENKLLEGAIKGYVAGLEDPYTEYYTKEEMEEFTEQTMGNFVGIGVYMSKDTEKNVIVVISPIKDSPAAKAGILPGDIISKVDGVAYTGDQMSEASTKIKSGEPGTTVKIEIIRDGETKELEITRSSVKLNHIESEKLSNNIGYLAISTFDSGCAKEFKEKFEELQKQGITSLIIDIRNNGGGIVEEALDIADLIIEKDKPLLITVDKNQKEETTYAKIDPEIKMPIVLLTNGNSASASEILAGILKAYDKATVVGTKTYGKGVIQKLMSLTDGSGIKITTNEYYTPKHEKINKIGISPDIEVELPSELQNQLMIERTKDTQLQKAIELLKK